MAVDCKPDNPPHSLHASPTAMSYIGCDNVLKIAPSLQHGKHSKMLMSSFLCSFFKNPHPRIYLLILEGGRKRGGDKQMHINERETWISSFPHAPYPGIEPATFRVWDDAPATCAIRPGPFTHSYSSDMSTTELPRGPMVKRLRLSWKQTAWAQTLIPTIPSCVVTDSLLHSSVPQIPPLRME